MITYAAARTMFSSTWPPAAKNSGATAAAPAPVVGAVLAPVAAHRHRAPCRRPVLRAIEEEVLALAARLHARPVAADLRLVEDAEQRRHGAVDGAARGLERGPPGLVDRDGQRCVPGGLANRVRHLWSRFDHERPDRLPHLAQPRRVSRRDPIGGGTGPLLPQPPLCLLGGPDPVPVGWEVMVVRVDEALQQLEPPGRLRPPSRLDLLADASLLALV